jgi:bifunctional UDP-N-acetylglucosamine pyrophosphorylase/glucosamine-1-phosphate N-acetyltransferase
MSQSLAIVLAAGKGTRMKSDLPKVLFEVRGRPMIHYVLDALFEGGIHRALVVVGHRAEMVRSALADRDRIEFVLQAEQLGTGHAVMACRDHLAGHDGPVMVVAGDSPMMQSSSIAALLEEYDRQEPACILGTICKQDPAGLGRIVRDAAGNFQAIVEEKDASEEQLRIREVNMSYYVFRCRDLLDSLDHLRADNAQGEYYITDCPGVLVAQGKRVSARNVLQPCEALSINTIEELAAVEEAMASSE